jgi:hypothetical protein
MGKMPGKIKNLQKTLFFSAKQNFFIAQGKDLRIDWEISVDVPRENNVLR